MAALSEIQVRDPFVLVADGRYHLFGTTDTDAWVPPATGFDCWTSRDLEQWEGPVPAFRPPAGFWSDRNFWAPEVHEHDGAFYMFASFKSADACRGTAVLRSALPTGPYLPHSDGPVTPGDWECLDGTLFVDDAGDPWIVYCHEWIQVMDGEVVAQRLSTDLTRTVGEPVVLFRASETPWVRPLQDERVAPGRQAYVTDGPFLYRHSSGALLMLWSSIGDQGYAMGVARSASGSVLGPWEQADEPIWSADGGHGMVFRALDGRLLLTLHQPNRTPDERAVLRQLVEDDETIRLAEG